MKTDEEYVTKDTCGEVSHRVLEKLEQIERRLFKDNGTLSIQTRLDRHEQIMRALVWATSVTVGTGLTAAVLGLVVMFRWVLSHGGM